MPDKVNAKSFIIEVENWFTKSDIIETNMYLSKLINMCYKGKRNIEEYIMKMYNLVSKLNSLILKLSEKILVHFILIFFLTQFNPFQGYL